MPKIETEEEEEEEEKTRRRRQSRRLFVPDEEKARSQKRDWQDGIAGRSLAESGYQNVERRKVLEPPRKNHGIFPGARLPRDEPFFEEEEKLSSSSSSSSSSTIKRLDRLPQYMSEIERFRKIDLAEEQKRERETLRARRTNEITSNQRNLEREKLNKEKEDSRRKRKKTVYNLSERTLATVRTSPAADGIR